MDDDDQSSDQSNDQYSDQSYGQSDDQSVPDELWIDDQPDAFDASDAMQMSLDNVEDLPGNFYVTVTGPGDFPEPSGDTANA